MKIYGSREEKQYLVGVANLAASIWLLAVLIVVGISVYFPVGTDPLYRPMEELRIVLQAVGLAACAAAILVRCMSKGVSVIWGVFPLAFMVCIIALPMPYSLFAVIPMMLSLIIVLLLPDQWEKSLRWTSVQHRMPHLPGPYRG